MAAPRKREGAAVVGSKMGSEHEVAKTFPCPPAPSLSPTPTPNISVPPLTAGCQ